MKSVCKQPVTFGTVAPDVEYRNRPAAYAVIFDAAGRVAVVKGARGYFLPGGGSLSNETPEDTVRREVREELGSEVSIRRRIGEAIQYFSADDVNYRMHANFFRADLEGEPTGVGEYEPEWLSVEEVEELFFHQCHVWAVKLAAP
jgi:8-oxo-dGTP diphosphatase